MVELSNKKSLLTFNLRVENANLNETKARLVLESPKKSITYPVNIDSGGNCSVSFIPENLNSEGKIYLEVISEDFYHKAWEDQYTYLNEVTKEPTNVEKYYQRGLQKLKVTPLNENSKGKHINILLNHTAKRYGLTESQKTILKQNTSNLL